MSAPSNPEIFTATQFTIGFFEAQFEPAPPSDIEAINAERREGTAKLIGASTRELVAFDSAYQCMVAVNEIYGLGEIVPVTEITDGHYIVVYWLDSDEDCTIDVDSGQVWIGDDKEETDLSNDTEKARRIISALAAVADKGVNIG